MNRDSPAPLVHLELHTGNRAMAAAFLTELCGWHSEELAGGGHPYLSLGLGALSGGIVECPTPRSLWLPYAEVEDIESVTERARGLGSRVLLAPREGPNGWRSVITAPCGGELAFWQPKE